MRTARLLNLVGILLIIISSKANNPNLINNIEKQEEIKTLIAENFGRSNTYFEKNDGQFNDDFVYRFSNAIACVDFYNNRVVFGLRKASNEFNPKQLEDPLKFDYCVWEIGLENSNKVKPSSDQLNYIQGVNYFTKSGKSLQKAITDKIVYENIYDNIDLVFYKNKEGMLKYDFFLKPGSKLSDIKLNYKGVDDLEIQSDGKLSYNTKWGQINEASPYSYLSESGDEVSIDYNVEHNIVSFSSDVEIVSEEIVLDPIYVDWSTYFYGTGKTGLTWTYTAVYDLDIDDDDYVYATGITNDRFPTIKAGYDTTTNGFYDAFVCKLSPKGDSIIWFSYLGGSQYEYCFTLTVNQQQQPVVSGFTWSEDFPITANAYDSDPDIGSGWTRYYKGFVTKFNERGDSLIFSTYLGGNGSDLIHSMTLDDSNYIYIAGETKSTDYPTTAGCFQSKYGGDNGGGSWWTGGDAFLTKIKPDGTDLVFSTYIGGENADVAYEVALSPSNEIYLVGKTASDDFPLTPGSSIFNRNVKGTLDGFVCKFEQDGNNLVYSKMMGGSGEDWFEGVYINEIDEAYVAGISKSSDFYTSNKAYQKSLKGGADIVVVKLNRLGQNIRYSTYIGGSNDELYYSGFIYNSNVRIAVNVREEAIVCGISRSTDFPITSDALYKTNPSAISSGFWNSSATICKLNYLGDKLLYGTYFGGSSYEVPGANRLKRISCFTNILYGGFTNSSDYPTTVGAYKETKQSAGTGFFWTGFISKFRDTLYTEVIDLALKDTIVECDNVFEILDAKNKGADILWSNGFTEEVQIIQDTGNYWVQATYGCDTVRDSIRFELEYSPKVPILPNDSTYCDNFPAIELDAKHDTIPAEYLWYNGSTAQTDSIFSEGKYWVDITTPNCGSASDTVNYILRKTPTIELVRDTTFCDSINWNPLVGLGGNDEIYVWSTLDSTNTTHIQDTGLFSIRIMNYCGEDSVAVKVAKLLSPETLLPEDSVFCNTINLKVKIGDPENKESYIFSDIVNSTSFGFKDSIVFTAPGVYEAAISNKCGISKDTLNLGVLYTPVLDLPVDTTFCDAIYLPVVIGSLANDEVYDWNSGKDTSERLFTAAQFLKASISNKCGIATDSFTINLVASPTASLPEDSVFCNSVSLLLDAEISEPSTYLWQDGSNNPQYNANITGFYKVVVSNYCGSASDSLQIGLITTPTVELGEDKVFCGALQPVDLIVGTSQNNEQYLWSNGDLTPNTTLTQQGMSWVTLSNKCGVASDSIRLIISENPNVYLGKDTTLCGNFAITLDAGNPGFRYQWFPYGETTQTIQATEQRVYKLIVYNEYDCEGSDEFEIDGECISTIDIPSAFSPNGDGLNDVFNPVLVNYQDYQLRIYNRWGEQIFYSNDAQKGWDGKYKGHVVPQGTYLYQLNFISTEQMQNENHSGFLQVLE